MPKNCQNQAVLPIALIRTSGVMTLVVVAGGGEIRGSKGDLANELAVGLLIMGPRGNYWVEASPLTLHVAAFHWASRKRSKP